MDRQRHHVGGGRDQSVRILKHNTLGRGAWLRCTPMRMSRVCLQLAVLSRQLCADDRYIYITTGGATM